MSRRELSIVVALLAASVVAVAAVIWFTWKVLTALGSANVLQTVE